MNIFHIVKGCRLYLSDGRKYCTVSLLRDSVGGRSKKEVSEMKILDRVFLFVCKKFAHNEWRVTKLFDILSWMILLEMAVMFWVVVRGQVPPQAQVIVFFVIMAITVMGLFYKA